MSKILQAMKHVDRDGSALTFRLEAVGMDDIFPMPPADQQSEFVGIANSIVSEKQQTSSQVIAIMSTISGEGASYVSFNVARHLAAIYDRKVAWVDGNFQSPQARLAGREPGLRELLQDPNLLNQIPTGNNLVVVPNGVARIKTVDVLSSASYHRLLDSFRKRFFVTVVDGPPINESHDAAHLALPVDAVLLVVERGRLKYEVINHGLKKLADRGINISGTILNRRSFDIPRAVYDRI